MKASCLHLSIARPDAFALHRLQGIGARAVGKSGKGSTLQRGKERPGEVLPMPGGLFPRTRDYDYMSPKGRWKV